MDKLPDEFPLWGYTPAKTANTLMKQKTLLLGLVQSVESFA
jgi:hypothetical protein